MEKFLAYCKRLWQAISMKGDTMDRQEKPTLAGKQIKGKRMSKPVYRRPEVEIACKRSDAVLSIFEDTNGYIVAYRNYRSDQVNTIMGYFLTMDYEQLAADQGHTSKACCLEAAIAFTQYISEMV